MGDLNDFIFCSFIVLFPLMMRNDGSERLINKRSFEPFMCLVRFWFLFVCFSFSMVMQ